MRTQIYATNQDLGTREEAKPKDSNLDQEQDPQRGTKSVRCSASCFLCAEPCIVSEDSEDLHCFLLCVWILQVCVENGLLLTVMGYVKLQSGVTTRGGPL